MGRLLALCRRRGGSGCSGKGRSICPFAGSARRAPASGARPARDGSLPIERLHAPRQGDRGSCRQLSPADLQLSRPLLRSRRALPPHARLSGGRRLPRGTRPPGSDFDGRMAWTVSGQLAADRRPGRNGAPHVGTPVLAAAQYPNLRSRKLERLLCAGPLGTVLRQLSGRLPYSLRASGPEPGPGFQPVCL